MGYAQISTILSNHPVFILMEVDDFANRMVCPNVIFLDTVIAGYLRCGKLQHALTLFHKMEKKESEHLSGHTFVYLLKACAKLKDLERGSEIQAEVTRTGLLERDVFVGSALVGMYAKCGWLFKAQDVFDKLPVRNTVVWNTLIAGYVDFGHDEAALNCFRQMQREGVSPSAVTYVCTLKACSSLRATHMADELHAEIERRGLLEVNIYVGSTMVDMYAKCGSLSKAQYVFDKLPVRNDFSWTALIAGYADHGRGEDALECFEQMQGEGVFPNTVTFMCSLKACGSIGATEKGQEIHAELERMGLLDKNLSVGSSLVDMYVKCGSFSKAQQVFDKLNVRDGVLWNSLIAGYAEHGYGEETHKCFKQMQVEGIFPDAVTLVCGLKACGSTGAMVKGQEIHVEIERTGLLEKNLSVGSTLIDMYFKLRLFSKAQQVFDRLPVRNVVSWNTLIAGFAENGHGQESLSHFEGMQLEGVLPDSVTFVCILKACIGTGAIEKGQEIHAEIERRGLLASDILVGSTLLDMYVKFGLLRKAQQVFDRLSPRNIVCWNTLLAGYAEKGLAEQALICLEKMQSEGIVPNACTYVCSLKACTTIGATDKGLELHAAIEKKGLLEQDLVIGSTLVSMYAKCTLPISAQQVFDKLPLRDAVSWNALIAGYAQMGESKSAFHFFDRMLGEGVKPDPVTFIVVLNTCSRTGLFTRSQTYFEAMSKGYGITPTVEHHACIVDLLSRAGCLDEAVKIIDKMPICPSPAVWRSVLGASRGWGNVELGKQAFEQATHLDATDAAPYILMSYTHAAADGQAEANKLYSC